MKTKRNKRTYHTSIIIMAKLGILPEKIKATLPTSTYHDFINKDYSNTIGWKIEEFEYFIKRRHLFNKIKILEEKIHKWKSRNHLKNMIIWYLKNYKNKSEIKIKRVIVKTVKKVSKFIAKAKILKELNMSASTYSRYKKEVNSYCKESPIKKCYSKHPNQLSITEQKNILDLCNKKEFSHYYLINLYWLGKRLNKIACDKSTFYKYVKKLGIKRTKPKSRRKKHKIGLRASRPNQYWHADVTIFRTADGKKHYLYFIIDNYSRFILNWKVSTELSSEIRQQTIQEAYEEFVDDDNKPEKIICFVDGGPENKGYVDHYLSQEHIPIKKIVAQEEIDFSNSMIEAFNSTIKYSWLYRKSILDTKELKNEVKNFIKDYNDQKPAGVLEGLTPNEVYFETGFDWSHHQEFKKNAIQERRDENRQYACNSHKE